MSPFIVTVAALVLACGSAWGQPLMLTPEPPTHGPGVQGDQIEDPMDKSAGKATAAPSNSWDIPICGPGEVRATDGECGKLVYLSGYCDPATGAKPTGNHDGWHNIEPLPQPQGGTQFAHCAERYDGSRECYYPPGVRPQGRTYTLAEIDRMRAAIRKQLDCGGLLTGDIECDIEIELRLQTDITIGAVPEAVEGE